MHNGRRVPTSFLATGSLPTTPKLGSVEGGNVPSMAPVNRLTPGPIQGGSPSSVSSANSSTLGFPSAPADTAVPRRLPTNAAPFVPRAVSASDGANISFHSNVSDCPQVSQRRAPVQAHHREALLRQMYNPQTRGSPPVYQVQISATNTSSLGYPSAGSLGGRMSSESSSGSLRRTGPPPIAPPTAQSVKVVTVQGRPVPMSASLEAERGGGAKPPLSHRSGSSADSSTPFVPRQGGVSRFTPSPQARNFTPRFPFHTDPLNYNPHNVAGRSGSAANSDKDLPPSRGSSDTPGRQRKPPTEPAPLEHRLKQREKQLKLGRVTIGYRNYRLLVPFHDRQQGNPDHPTTPDPTTDCSKRQWDNLISCWRRDLHRWDTEEDASRKAMKSLQTDGALGRVPYEDVAAYTRRTQEELERLYAEINERHSAASAPLTPELAPQTSSGSGLHIAPFVIGGMGLGETDNNNVAANEFGVIGVTCSKGGTDCSSVASGYDPNRYRAPGSYAASIGATSVERKTSSRNGSDHTLGSGAPVAEEEDQGGQQRLNEELARWQASVTLPNNKHVSTDSTDPGTSVSMTSTVPMVHVRLMARDLWGKVGELSTRRDTLLDARTVGTLPVPITPPTQTTLQRPPPDDHSLDNYTSCLMSALASQFDLDRLFVAPVGSAPICLDTNAGRMFFRDTVKRILRESAPAPGVTMTGDEYWASVVASLPVMVYTDELLYNPSAYGPLHTSTLGARSSHPSPIVCRLEDGGSDIEVPHFEGSISDDERSPEITQMVTGGLAKQGGGSPTFAFGDGSSHDPRYVSSTPEFSEVLLMGRWTSTPEDSPSTQPGPFVGSGALLDANETGSGSPLHHDGRSTSGPR